VDGSERAFVSDLSPSGLRGSALGLYSGALGLAAIASSLLAGAIWELWGPEITFIFGAGAAGLAAVGLMVWARS
jgi:MFS family permease